MYGDEYIFFVLTKFSLKDFDQENFDSVNAAYVW